MTYCGVSIDVLQSVPGALPVASAAEMLMPAAPKVSASLARYAMFLVENQICSIGQTPDLMNARSILAGYFQGRELADAKLLENFGNSLTLYADNSTNPQDLHKIAYIAYAATSQYGPIKKRVLMALQNAEAKMGSGFSYPSMAPSERAGDAPAGGPPPGYGAPSGGPPPGYAKPSAGPSKPAPGAGGPPPGYGAPAGGPPGYGSAVPPAGGIPQFYAATNLPSLTPQQQKVSELLTFARDGFKGGAYDVAMTAIVAAIEELQTMQ